MSVTLDNGDSKEWGSFNSNNGTRAKITNPANADISQLSPNQSVYAAWKVEFETFLSNLPNDNPRSFAGLERIKAGNLSSLAAEYNRRYPELEVVWMRVTYGPTIQIVLNNIYSRQLFNVQYEAVFKKKAVSTQNFTFLPVEPFKIDQTNFKTLTVTNTNPYMLIQPQVAGLTLAILIITGFGIVAAVIFGSMTVNTDGTSLIGYLIQSFQKVGDILINTLGDVGQSIQDIANGAGAFGRSAADLLGKYPWLMPVLVGGSIVLIGGIVVLIAGGDFGIKTKKTEVVARGSRKNVSGNVGSGIRQVASGGTEFIRGSGQAASQVIDSTGKALPSTIPVPV